MIALLRPKKSKNMSREPGSSGEFSAPHHEETSPDIGLPPKEEKVPDELEVYRVEAEEFLATYRELFWAIAGDRSLRFRVGNGFFIDLKEGAITFDLRDWKWKHENNLSDWQIVWSVCHELEHFKDLQNEPKELLENFEYMEKKAEELAPQVLDAWRAHFPDGVLPEYLVEEVPWNRKGDKKPFVVYWTQRKLHMLYNCLDDAYINQPLGLRSRIFGPGGSQEGEVKRLYRDFLFPTDPHRRGVPPEPLRSADYTSLLQSYQLTYSILRGRMVPDQAISVSPPVLQKLGGFSDDAARSLGITFAKEAAYITDIKNTNAKSAGWRYREIRRVVEPVFLDLLFQDLKKKENVPPKMEEGKKDKGAGESGQGEPGPGGENKPAPNDPWKESDDKPEPIDKEVVEDFLKKQKEKEKEKRQEKRVLERRQRLTPDKRADAARRHVDELLCKEHGVDPRHAAEYRRIEHSIDEYKGALAAVFERLIQSIEVRIIRFWEEGFKSGRFNVEHFVRKYGAELATGNAAMIPWDRLDTFDRREFEHRLSLFPEVIRVRLKLDGSGSMNEARILALKQLCVLLLEGLSTFQETMNLRFRLTDPLVIDTEIGMWGSVGASKTVKPFSHAAESDPDRELVNRFRAFGEINSSYGMTCDAEALWAVSSDITPDKANQLASGRAKEFLFNVTDGGSNQVSAAGFPFVAKVPETGPVPYVDEENGEKKEVSINLRAAQDTRNAVSAIETQGVVARAFQVGEDVSEPDKATFQSIWGKNGERVRHPKDLAAAVASVLADQLEKIDFEISYSPVEEETE